LVDLLDTPLTWKPPNRNLIRMNNRTSLLWVCKISKILIGIEPSSTSLKYQKCALTTNISNKLPQLPVNSSFQSPNDILLDCLFLWQELLLMKSNISFYIHLSPLHPYMCVYFIIWNIVEVESIKNHCRCHIFQVNFRFFVIIFNFMISYKTKKKDFLFVLI